MREELEKKLFDKYWFFKPNGDIRETLMPFGFECGDGWYDLIDELCEKIYEYYEEHPDAGIITYGVNDYSKFEVVQVKEKYAGLRFYINFGSEYIHDLITEYENKSYTICENCGKIGKERKRGGWYFTRCDDCWKVLDGI